MGDGKSPTRLLERKEIVVRLAWTNASAQMERLPRAESVGRSGRRRMFCIGTLDSFLRQHDLGAKLFVLYVIEDACVMAGSLLISRGSWQIP